ncbi:receptor activity-modifying protein 1-like [Triplophysa dalaica]|nr:receptor activity-modifying protein 1-like [Triplophysa dalaica]
MEYGGYCRVNFNANMTELGVDNWCNVEMIVRSYHELTKCLETMSMFAECFYPNRVVEGLFVAIHQQYFHSCNDEDELPDAPAEVVLAATLLPIIIIPFIVYIVVWKSSLRD